MSAELRFVKVAQKEEYETAPMINRIKTDDRMNVDLFFDIYSVKTFLHSS